ncbi:MAG: hypothetical protein DWP98_07370 [Bacteroidetes bacterium]|nr:MAG: hypothetical protein DWP98_07370 [Bacteroidota bacterium]MBL1143792.1 hypothetical protein [Bacteroidota bacterium]MCB0802829.1 hypothetical protein [Flavobacteriales bacterium]NOG56593.1 hypothetical protein [Bacteroidota bacterium]
MDIEFQKKWDTLNQKMIERFGEKIDVQAILFIIGLQELGINATKFTKDQKLEVMHVAVCTILEPYGYYEYDGRDKDGWPHWKAKEKLPNLNTLEQEQLIKQSIIEYFN